MMKHKACKMKTKTKKQQQQQKNKNRGKRVRKKDEVFIVFFALLLCLVFPDSFCLRTLFDFQNYNDCFNCIIELNI